MSVRPQAATLADARAVMKDGRYQEAWTILAGIVGHVPPDIVVKAKAFCALGLAQTLESSRSLYGTDWEQVVRWRRVVTELAPDNLNNWSLLLMALLYGGQPDAARALLAQAEPHVAAHLRQATGDAVDILPALRRSADNIYGRAAPQYLKRGLPVVPCFGKIALFDGWRDYADRLPDAGKIAEWAAVAWAQIGVVLGPCSELAMLNIDAADPALVAAIVAALPASPWHRTGAHGVAVAFRRSAAVPCKGLSPDRSPVFDVLGDAKRLMVPPSIHPDTGRPYTATCSLGDVLDDLPALPEDYADRIQQETARRGFIVRMQADP